MKYWETLKQAKRIAPILFFLALILKANFALASNKFLTLPFNFNPPLMQGWNYNFSSKTHQGVDYYAAIGTDLVATADGTVKRYYQPGNNFVYGNFIVIDHGNGYKTLYAHLSEVLVDDGVSVKRGQPVARSGISGTDNSHLHYENLTSWSNGKGPNRGYGYRMDPYDLYTTSNSYPPNAGYKELGPDHLWINNYPSVYAPPKPSTLSVASTEPNKVNLSWTKSEDVQFQKYEIYRSTVQNGTDDSSQRTLAFQSTDQNTLSATDSNATSGNTYYYRIFTFLKNGMAAKSDEVSIELKRVITKITDNSAAQTNPVVADGKIFWQDYRPEASGQRLVRPAQLYYYDLATGNTNNVTVGDFVSPTKWPELPQGAGKKIVFQANDSYGTGKNIYVWDTTTKTALPLVTATGEQANPVVSDDGVVVWQDLRNGKDYDLYYLDLKNSSGEQKLVSTSGNQIMPKIWGNKIIWKDTRVGNRTDLYCMEIGGTERVLAQNVKQEDAADLWRNYVVWQTSGKVTFLDVNTGQTKVLANTGAGYNPRVRDGKVVYTLLAGGGISYIHVYDIATGNETKIDFSLNYSSNPFLSGNILVFDSSEKLQVPNMEIYLTYL